MLTQADKEFLESHFATKDYVQDVLNNVQKIKTREGSVPMSNDDFEKIFERMRRSSEKIHKMPWYIRTKKKMMEDPEWREIYGYKS